MEMTPETWEKIKALFEATLLQEPAKRATFLVRLCPESDLREQVEKLLANHAEAGSFLSEPILDRQKLTAAPISAQLFAPGEVVDARFKVVRLLGKGEIKTKIEVKVAGASASAIAAVEKAGGKVELPPKQAAEAA